MTFIDKNNPNDQGFTLTLSQRTEYDQMVKAAAKHLEMDPTYLQFFKTQSYREAPGHALRCTFDGTLKDLLVYFRPKTPKKMFYQKLAIPIHELENKKQIKCTFLSTDQVWNSTLFWKKRHDRKHFTQVSIPLKVDLFFIPGFLNLAKYVHTLLNYLFLHMYFNAQRFCVSFFNNFRWTFSRPSRLRLWTLETFQLQMRF